MKVAVVKPDHLGDFALSIPTITAIAQRHPDTIMFTATATRSLAAHAFPKLEARPLDLPHLSKFKALTARESAPVDLHQFDFVYFLRRDAIFTPAWTGLMARQSVLVSDEHETHETKLQAMAVWQTGLHYDLPDSHVQGQTFPTNPKRVGLCISAGFYANRWPTLLWVQLGRMLQAQGIAVSIVCGPFELNEAKFLSRLLQLPENEGLLIGSSDFQGFLDRVGALDVVVANDGGTAHICSLRVPVVSLFGGSPYRRYAPYGKHNRLLTRQLKCSPCCQYHDAIVNGCVTQECLTGIEPRTVIDALFANSRDAGESTRMTDDSLLFFGVSHA